MNRRLALTFVWLAAFILVILTIEVYYWGYPTERKLIAEERLEVYTPVASVYFVYLAGILCAWYLKPFPKLRFDAENDRPRFIIALITTVLFNTLVLYLVSLAHWTAAGAVPTIKSAMKLAALFSILVAPVNAYYFGIKTPGGKGN
jgi:hypothetical protein